MSLPVPQQSAESRFRVAVDIVIDRFEGGSVLVHDDGGATRYGIAQRYNPDLDVEHLTRDVAVQRYRERYYDALRCGEMTPGIGFLVFDTAVNPGPQRAADWLQDELRVERDGVVGPETLDASRRAPVLELIAGLTQRRVLWYVDETRRHPYKLKWLNGWLRRAHRGAVYATRISAGLPV